MSPPVSSVQWVKLMELITSAASPSPKDQHRIWVDLFLLWTCKTTKPKKFCFTYHSYYVLRFVFSCYKIKNCSPHLVHDGRLSTQTVVRETEPAPLAAVVRLRLDKLLAVTFLLLLLFLPPLLLTVAPLFGTLGAQFGHLGRTARETSSSFILRGVFRHGSRRGGHGGGLGRTTHESSQKEQRTNGCRIKVQQHHEEHTPGRLPVVF